MAATPSNPFTPSVGTTPPLLVGRDEAISAGGIDPMSQAPVPAHSASRPASPAKSIPQMLDEKNHAGVLISIDGIHGSALDDLRVIAQEVQHAFREGRQVAFISAGLPESVSDLLNENVLTFLRRAERYSLGAVDDSDVADALATPITRLGHDITDDALDIGTAGIGGYPYLIQTVGYESWRLARDGTAIRADHARSGADAARRRVGRLVHDPTLAALSAIDKSYLVAMAVDDGPSNTGDIARRISPGPVRMGG